MNSERLPGKVMKEIADKPLIGILLERLSKSQIPIILATSTNSENDTLVDYVSKKGIKVYRGSEDNVLERFYEAAKSVNADVIIRATGDNPLIDGNLIKKAYEKYVSYNDMRCCLSIGLSKSYPLGISATFFSFELLEEAYENASLPGEFEHVTPYISNNMPGNIRVIPFGGEINKFHYRLTVDNEEDFELNKVLIQEYNCAEASIYDIVNILDSNPELASINSGIRQKKWDD